jgi:hypothetical protein
MDYVTATARLLRVFYEEYKEREASTETIERKNPSILQMNYWKGYRGMSRIYIHTDCGVFFYDIRKKAWDIDKKRNSYDVSEIDMERLKHQAFEMANATDEREFARYRG